MAILQISKIQQRTGNLVDLPQLDEAEFGWASDSKRLFIGKTTPNENVEVLTAYSNIYFSQIDGAIGNLDITASSLADGEVLVYDGTSWVNRGGEAGGLITLGSVSNVKIDGGTNGYVLQTDGTGNLSWTAQTGGSSGNGLPGGGNTQIQFNNSGNFGGAAGFTFDSVTKLTSLPGNLAVTSNVVGSNIVGNHFGNGFGLSALVGSNVTGTVANATYATNAGIASVAYAVSGGNVTGTVANATYSTSATNASALLQNTSSATTVYPTFTTSSANGNSSAVINTSISANLANGALIASTFVGNFSGNVTGNFTVNGSNTDVLFNDSGNANATSGFTFNKSSNLVTISGNLVSANANLGNTVTANFYVGDGSSLTAINAANVTGMFSSVSATGNISGANVIASSYNIRSVANGISAAGSTQGTAAVISREFNQVTNVDVGSGIILPVATPGMEITVTNTNANSLNVYPASGAAIGTLPTNTAFNQSGNSSTMRYIAMTSTQWYVIGAVYA